MELSEKKCIPCEGGVSPLDSRQIAELKKQISSDWMVLENSRIKKKYLFVNYKHTMEFVNKVAGLAEAEGHHPVMHVSYGEVGIELWTHAIKGLSENDFIMAAKIDRL